jgi:hypothetical protein
MFYLASTDHYNVELPRRIWRLKRMSGPGQEDLWLARIDPPIIDQRHGSEAQNIDIVLLATRHKGASLFPVTQWPVLFTCFVPRSTMWRTAIACRRANFGTLPGPNFTKPKKTHIRNA